MNVTKTERPIYYNYTEGILYVWVEKKSVGSFKVKLQGNIVTAYDFEGDVTISEVKKGKQIFTEYEGL